MPSYILQIDQNRKKQDLIKFAKETFLKLLEKKYSPEEARQKVREETGVVI